MGILKAFVGFLGVAMLLTIVFVRAGEAGEMSGGEQASRILEAGAGGVTDIIRAATGAPS